MKFYVNYRIVFTELAFYANKIGLLSVNNRKEDDTMNDQYVGKWQKVSLALHEMCLEAKRLGVNPAETLQKRLAEFDLEVSVQYSSKILNGILFMNVNNNASDQIVRGISTKLKAVITEEGADFLAEDLIGACAEQFQAQAADIYVCAVAGEWKKFEERLLDLSEKDTITFAELVKVFWSNI